MANYNSHRRSDNTNYGNRDEERDRYSRRDYNQYQNDYDDREDNRRWRRYDEDYNDEVSSWFGDEDAERRRRMDRRLGAHRGRGPKGYTRSDERIREDINDRLSDDSYLDATEIDVTVNNGEVTLTGTVENRIDKRRAEDLAEDVSGVKNVQNQLRVKQTTTTTANGLKNEYQG